MLNELWHVTYNLQSQPDRISTYLFTEDRDKRHNQPHTVPYLKIQVKNPKNIRQDVTTPPQLSRHTCISVTRDCIFFFKIFTFILLKIFFFFKSEYVLM